jgi:predicted anti-sigma-YlaC factor YlaD
VRLLVSRRIDRDVSRAEAAVLEEHLRACRGCAGFAAGVDASTAVVRSGAPARVPPAHPAIHAELERLHRVALLRTGA